MSICGSRSTAHRAASMASLAVLAAVLAALLAALLGLCAPAAALAPDAPRCPAGRPELCLEGESIIDEHYYTIKGNISLIIKYKKGKYFELKCSEAVSLEDATLPAFASVAPVPLARLGACAPPAAGYARALRARNLTAAALELAALPARPALRAAHLSGLALRSLVLAAAAPQPPQPDLLPALAALPALRDLRLSRLRLSAPQALLLPRALRSLSLAEAGLTVLPAAAFAPLAELERLIVRDPALRRLELGSAPALRVVEVSAPLEGVDVGPRVEALTMVAPRSAELRGDCSALRNVTLQSAPAPPASWLARCGGVRALRLTWVAALGADELRGASSLRTLQATRCGLSAPAPHWLADAHELRSLDLSHNRLDNLPGSLASDNAQLEEVAVTHNRLGREAVALLAALPALRSLALDHNPLGDLCGGSDTYVTDVLSPLFSAHALRSLRLRATNATRICSDWRAGLPRLAALDLRNNTIADLSRADLQWRREVPALVDLRGNPSRVAYRRDDYRAELAEPAPAPSAPVTTLLLDYAAPCDCSEYWFARLQRERRGPAPVALQRLLCAHDGTRRALAAVPPEELLCDVPLHCPAGCRCRVSGASSELHCERAGLTRVPRAAPPLPPARALLLRGNNISHVSPADVPPALEKLDLRDNRVSRLGAGAAAALLGARGPALLLGGNPLDCGCGALPLLGALAAAPARVLDLGAARCADGRALGEAAARAPAACAAWPLWPALAGALLLAAASALAAACLARPAARHRIKRFLFERGLCPAGVAGVAEAAAAEEAEEAGARPYDAFVSFSHRDEQFAAALAARLEAGGARRLCLHERDWVPGDWIPAQIARSVRRSRRTLVLLSEHFLRSTWARAELREAYAAALRDHRPRLLLLLLPGFPAAAAQRADPALRAYLSAVTYLCWDDARFWHKLELAVPPRREPAATPAPSAATPAPASAPAPSAPAPPAPRPPPPPP